MAGEDTLGQHPLAVAPTLTHIARLQRDRRYRDTHGLFFVEGVRNFVTAVDHGYTFDALFYSERLLTAPIARKFVRQLKRAGVPFASVSPEQFRAVSQAERASGVGAVLRQRIQRIQQVAPGEHPCWVALTHVRAPGNLGTLLRTSAAVGAAGLILLGGIDPFDPAVVRASMGALFQQQLVRASTEQLRQWVDLHGLLVVGASPDGTLAYDDVPYTRPTVLMLGAERSGLSQEQRALCRYVARIPMVAEADSLNLGVAGGLLMYAVVRALQSL
jgi:TrmH family RNA methyltransferase